MFSIISVSCQENTGTGPLYLYHFDTIVGCLDMIYPISYCLVHRPRHLLSCLLSLGIKFLAPYPPKL